MGNLTRDPELRQTPNGRTSVALVWRWTVLTETKVMNGKKQPIMSTSLRGGISRESIPVSYERTPLLSPGPFTKPQLEQDGQKRNKVEVVASDVTFLDSRSGGGSDEVPATATDEPQSAKPKPSKPRWSRHW